MDVARNELLDAYSRMFDERIDCGFEPTLLTFMFNPVVGNEATQKAIMAREIERIYYMLLTRLWRHPDRLDRFTHWPLWLASPDRPVLKRDKISKRDAVINDGLHYHACAATPPSNRLGPDIALADFIDENQILFSGPGKRLFRLHAEPIVRDPSYVVGYCLKSVKRRDFDTTDIVILPHASSEHTQTTRAERRYDREVAGHR